MTGLYYFTLLLQWQAVATKMWRGLKKWRNGPNISRDRASRGVQKAGYGRIRSDPSARDEQHLLGSRPGFIGIVGDHDHGRADFGADIEHQGQHVGGQTGAEAIKRLIEKQQRPAAGKGAGQRDTLAFAA